MDGYHREARYSEEGFIICLRLDIEKFELQMLFKKYNLLVLEVQDDIVNPCDETYNNSSLS